MLAIRLQRTGRRNLATYRVVVAESSRPAKGRFVEILGHYLPTRDPAVLEVNKDRVEYWRSKGAIPSDTVARLLKREGLKHMDDYIRPYAKRRAKNAPEEEPAPAAPAAQAETPVAEEPAAPVEEVPATEAEAPAEKSEDTPEEPAAAEEEKADDKSA